MNESTGRVKGISSFLKCAQTRDEYVDHNPSHIQKKIRKRPRKGNVFSYLFLLFIEVLETTSNQDRQNIIQNEVAYIIYTHASVSMSNGQIIRKA